MKRDIVLFPHAVLSKPCSVVTLDEFFSDEMKALYRDLEKTLNSINNALGLAANQIAWPNELLPYVALGS